MNTLDSAHASRSTSALARGDGVVPAPSVFAGEDALEIENWLGYESIHPLTWVPGHAATDGSLRVE